MFKFRSWAVSTAIAAFLAGGSFVFSQQPAPAPASSGAAHSSVAVQQKVTSKDLTAGQMEQFLETAQITNIRPAEKGTTHAQRATLSDGHMTHDAHIQTIDVYMARAKVGDVIENNFRDSYKYNIAAYRLNKMLDLNLVPVCVYRPVNGKPAAVDWWVDNVQFDDEGRRAKHAEAPDQEMWVRQLNMVRDFDQLINNEDRNQGNLLIDTDWKIWAIDHSRSFHPDFMLRDPRVLRRISNKMLEGMKKLNQQNLEANLTPYLTEDEIQALLARRDLLVKFFENEVNDKGPDAVLLDIPHGTPVVVIP